MAYANVRAMVQKKGGTWRKAQDGFIRRRRSNHY